MFRWSSFLLLPTLFCRLLAECVIEENSRTFVPVCDIKRIFPEIEAPNVDNFRNLFRLRGMNLELLQSLDRENLIATQKCDPSKLSNYNSNGQCVLILDLSAAGPKFYPLSITVADVNDNVPTFDRLMYNIKIAENSPSNYEVDLPQARDHDRGRNGTVVYSLQKSAVSHKFILLNPSSNGLSESPLKIKILQPFDRETEEDVTLVMIAKDLGDPPLSSSMIIKIEITDVNDHSPEFNQSSYRFNIPESIMQGQPVGRVFAFDRDVSSRISMMMSPSASSQIVDKFVVTSDGIISIKMALEYSSNNNDFRIPVIAIDGGVPALTATTTVFIHVTDINDNSPVIEVTSNNPNNRLLLTENCPSNTYIGKITVTDKDYGENGQVECKVDNNYLFNIEPIQNFEKRRYYKLVTAPLSNFDREIKDNHLLTIICHDKGLPQLTTSRLVTILINDENDNPPVFPQPYLSVKIYENQPAGTSVMTLTAIDKDIGGNSHIEYKLMEESLKDFNIDSNTGTVTTRAPFDREVIGSVTLKAMAYDNLLPKMQSNVTVHVTIVDENDNYPKFKMSPPIHVKENTDGLIGRVEAVDDDEGRNKEIEYYLINLTETFQISKLGDIIVARKSDLDREKMDRYSLAVGARDKGQRSLTSSTTVYVIVDDVNDNSPVFQLPKLGQQINISASTPLNTLIFTVVATDQDVGENSKIIFSLRTQELFVINSSEGGIFLNKTISNVINLPHRLIIYAKDCGIPSLTSTSSLTINYVKNGVSNPAEQGRKTELRTSSSRDLILSLGIGMVLLIFTCLMMLVTYFCVTIYIQKRRQEVENEDKDRANHQSRNSRWFCLCPSKSPKEVKYQNQRIVDKTQGNPLNATLERNQNYPICFNRWEKPNQFVEDDPQYAYREFTMKPVLSSSQSPRIYDRLVSVPDAVNPYWQYNTIDHVTHRTSQPMDSGQDRHLPEVIYHHGVTYIPHKSHPDIVNSNSSDEVHRIIYGEMSPSVVHSSMKLSKFPQTNYDNEKGRYESNNNLSSVEMLCQQADTQTTARFAGYVVGSPCYVNSFV